MLRLPTECEAQMVIKFRTSYTQDQSCRMLCCCQHFGLKPRGSHTEKQTGPFPRAEPTFGSIQDGDVSKCSFLRDVPQCYGETPKQISPL